MRCPAGDEFTLWTTAGGRLGGHRGSGGYPLSMGALWRKPPWVPSFVAMLATCKRPNTVQPASMATPAERPSGHPTRRVHTRCRAYRGCERTLVIGAFPARAECGLLSL